MQTFYFNTGVRPENVQNPPFPYEYHKSIGNVIRGSLCIPFQCENVPKDSEFVCACDNDNLHPGSKTIFVRKIAEGSNLISKFAYFRLPMYATTKDTIQALLNVPDSDLRNHCSDLYLLHTPEREKWLRENYEYWVNIRIVTANVKGGDWYGKRFFDIPFAFTEYHTK
jgi:hypothetical protein